MKAMRRLTGKSEEEMRKELKEELEEEEEAQQVKKVEINGKKYLKSSANILYDVETQDQIGTWNEKTNDIVFCELEEESSEEEDN